MVPILKVQVCFSDLVWNGTDQIGQDRTGQGRAGQGRAEQDRAIQNDEEENRMANKGME
jgi:hypothetical protein